MRTGLPFNEYPFLKLSNVHRQQTAFMSPVEHKRTAPCMIGLSRACATTFDVVTFDLFSLIEETGVVARYEDETSPVLVVHDLKNSAAFREGSLRKSHYPASSPVPN